MRVEDNVMQNPGGYDEAGAARFGTVFATPEEFATVFGGAHEEDPGGLHVTVWWHFETPQGRATVRNWYQGKPGELSICSLKRSAAKWAAAYFRRCNINANGSYK